MKRIWSKRRDPWVYVVVTCDVQCDVLRPQARYEKWRDGRVRIEIEPSFWKSKWTAVDGRTDVQIRIDELVELLRAWPNEIKQAELELNNARKAAEEERTANLEAGVARALQRLPRHQGV